MKRFAFTMLAVLLAGCMLLGCSRKKKKMVDVAKIRLDQDDPEASMKLALRGMADLQLEMSTGQRHLLIDYNERAQNNFTGYIVCGDALEMMKDPAGAAMAYWAAANYMRRIPFSPVRKGGNMRHAYQKLAALCRKHNWAGSGSLVKANLAMVNVYGNSSIVANMETNFQNRWVYEQRLISAKKQAQIQLALAAGEAAGAAIAVMLDDKDVRAKYRLRLAQQKLRVAQARYAQAKAALEAVKVGAPPESFALIREGNFPATMGMHFFSNFAANRAANANVVARVFGGGSGAASNAVANAAATGNTNAMVANFARLEAQTHAAEAAGQ